MKVHSEIDGGYLPNGGVLLSQGENTFSYRDLFPEQKEFIDEMIKAKVVAIIEQDEPAQVIPFPTSAPAPVASSTVVTQKTVKVRKRRAKGA